MKLKKPQVQLFTVDKSDYTTDYYLHVVTFFGAANVEAAGHGILPQSFVDNGSNTINLYYSATTGRDIPVLTPIVHFIFLGNDTLGDDTKFIINLKDKDTDVAVANIKPVHTTVADAEEDSRPI